MMEAMDDGRVCADCQDRPFETAGVEKKIMVKIRRSKGVDLVRSKRGVFFTI